MALFKSEEEKLKDEQEEIKRYEDMILKFNEYSGKVGHIHQGLSFWGGIWGTRKNGKNEFKSTKFQIHDTRLLIERNKMIIEFSNIKEIFNQNDNEAIILLNDDSGIPIKSAANSKPAIRKFIAFLNILNGLIEENKSNVSENNAEKSNDKIDRLLKLGEMYDKGLLSDEEFALMKNELLNGAKEDTTPQPEDDEEPSQNICENCGSEVSSDDIFCSECGTQIN